MLGRPLRHSQEQRATKPLVEESLHSACKQGLLGEVQHLIKNKNVDPNQPDFFDNTPLYLACLCGHKSVVQFLLNNGAILDLNTARGQRCYLSALTDEIRQILLEHIRTTSEQTADHNRSTDVFMRLRGWNNYLCSAALRRNKKDFRLTDPAFVLTVSTNYRNNFGFTIVDYATFGGEEEIRRVVKVAGGRATILSHVATQFRLYNQPVSARLLPSLLTSSSSADSTPSPSPLASSISSSSSICSSETQLEAGVSPDVQITLGNGKLLKAYAVILAARAPHLFFSLLQFRKPSSSSSSPTCDVSTTEIIEIVLPPKFCIIEGVPLSTTFAYSLLEFLHCDNYWILSKFPPQKLQRVGQHFGIASLASAFSQDQIVQRQTAAICAEFPTGVTLLRDLRQAINDRTYADIVLVINGTEMYAHKLLLIRCEYFRMMLMGNMREALEKRIELSGEALGEEVFLHVLEFIYTNSVRRFDRRNNMKARRGLPKSEYQRRKLAEKEKAKQKEKEWQQKKKDKEKEKEKEKETEETRNHSTAPSATEKLQASTTTGDIMEWESEMTKAQRTTATKASIIHSREALFKVMSFEESMQLAFNLIVVANEYLLPGLIGLCEDWLIQYFELLLANIDICELFLFADQYRAQYLRQSCITEMVYQHLKGKQKATTDSLLWTSIPEPVKQHIEQEAAAMKEVKAKRAERRRAQQEERERLRKERFPWY